MYHANPTHTGIGPDRPDFGTPKQLWSTSVDGVVYGEPLIANGRVYVVTENDTAYALDYLSGKVLWQQHVGTPDPRPCDEGTVNPIGMTATPVISGDTLYAVGRLQPTHHELFAFNIFTGDIRFHRSIDPPGVDPKWALQRAALLPANGRIYVAFGSNGDCGDYKGSVVSAPMDSAQGSLQSYILPAQQGGAMWASAGPTLDSNGDLLVATANTSSLFQFDYGNAVIRLSPSLAAKDYWAPTVWNWWNLLDLDTGSISPTILQNNLVFQGSKVGQGFLLRKDKLGGIGGELFSAQVCAGAYGGTAYDPPMLYVPCMDGLVALRIGDNSFQVAWRAAAKASNAPPILAYGSIWQIDRHGALLQLDPANGQLRSSTPLPAPSVAHFLTPTAASGRLFVTSGTNVLAFGS